MHVDDAHFDKNTKHNPLNEKLQCAIKQNSFVYQLTEQIFSITLAERLIANVCTITVLALSIQSDRALDSLTSFYWLYNQP